MSILLHILLINGFIFSAAQNSTLKLVHVIFRHGSRTPDEHEIYQNDPYHDLFKKKGFGQLTNEGKSGSYQLGKILRRKYDNFLGEDFKSDMVFTKSTNYDRTMMTALLVLAGLFPPSPKDTWNKELNWIPIPYTYEKFHEDFYLERAIEYCPAYFNELQEVLQSDEVKDLIHKHRKTYEIVNRNTGKVYVTLHDIFLLHQLLHTEQTMNLDIPNWALKSYSSIRDLATMQLYFENSNTMLRKLNGGHLLSRIMDNIKQKVYNIIQPPDRKIFLYSGHDNNVVGILAALNLYELHFPNFNAAVCIELHEDALSKKYFVKIFYIKDASAEPEELAIKDCGRWCELQKFEELVFPHLSRNYTSECNSQKTLD